MNPAVLPENIEVDDPVFRNAAYFHSIIEIQLLKVINAFPDQVNDFIKNKKANSQGHGCHNKPGISKYIRCD